MTSAILSADQEVRAKYADELGSERSAVIYLDRYGNITLDWNS